MKNYILILLVLTFSTALAQPNPQWFHMYDNQEVEYLTDVYALADGGYAACGYSSPRVHADLNSPMGVWVLLLDDDGEIVWSNVYQDDNIRQGSCSLVETDDGALFIGGYRYTEGWNTDVLGILIDSEGNEIWSNTFGAGSCLAVIELKSGEFAMTGFDGGQNGGFVACVNTEGDLIWRTNIPAEEFYNSSHFTCLRETDGGIITGGNYYHGNNTCDVWVAKTDFNGDVLWQRRIDTIDDYQSCRSIASGHANGFLLSGFTGHRENCYVSDMFLLKINAIGETQWTQTYHLDGGFQANERDTQECNQLIKLDEGFALVGYANYDRIINPIAIQVDENGNEIWSAFYNFSDDERYGNNNRFLAGVNGHDNSIIAGGIIQHNESNPPQNGFLMKLEPWFEHPVVFGYSPQDTVFTVLQADSVEFSVSARDQQGDAIYYQWTYDEEEVARDSLVTIHFPDLGLHEVACVVTDSSNAVEIRWHITVSDFFIRQTTPDSLRFTARRGSTLPFALDVACIEPDAPTIEWSVVNRDNDREYLGEADSIDVCFDLAGEWAVEAEAIWGEERESVRWAVDVRSVVWWWMPHEEAISVNQNEHCDFSVFPFDPDSDSLSVAWWLNGDSLDCIAEALSLDFPDLGEHGLTTIVRDGIEADTIRWQITVNDLGGIFDPNAIPTELALFPPAPNPFNSTTTIGYSLPAAGRVSLAVYDLSGREVASLVDGVKPAGTHEAVWRADGMASGVYVVKLDAGEKALMSKVVLVK